MSSAKPLDIKVVYTASGRGRRGGYVVRSSASSRALPLLILGLLNLVAAGGHYYWVCWDVDNFIYHRLVMSTAFVLQDGALGSNLKANPTRESASSSVASSEEAAPDDLDVFSTDTSRIVLWGSAYGWLTMAMLATCALGLAGGALLGSAGGTGIQRAGLIFAALGFVALIGVAYALWSKFGTKYTPDTWRLFMIGPVVVSAMFGVGIGRGGRRSAYFAAIMLILAGATTGVALYLGSLCNSIRPEDLPLALVPFMGVVFVMHSLWGWILLVLTSRLPR